MSLMTRLRAFFANSQPTVPVTNLPVASPALSVSGPPVAEPFVTNSEPTLPVVTNLEPAWLTDEEILRDEGVLFGLSDARTEGKIGEIRAYFAQQSAPFSEQIDQYTEKIGELNLLITEHENQANELQNQVQNLTEKQPAPVNFIRTMTTLGLSVTMTIGTFFLVDSALRPAFANQWITVGVFLAGMFNLFGQTSFFYETGSRLTPRRLLEEAGLPFAAALFILVQALATKPVFQALGLFLFVFFLFLLGGKLLLSTLTLLQTDATTLRANQQLIRDQQTMIPGWNTMLIGHQQAIDRLRVQKWPVVTALNRAQAGVTHLNAQRDRLISLFMSEFELASTLRSRLTEQQRRAILDSE